MEENGTVRVELSDKRARQIISGRLKPYNLSILMGTALILGTALHTQRELSSQSRGSVLDSALRHQHGSSNSGGNETPTVSSSRGKSDPSHENSSRRRRRRRKKTILSRNRKKGSASASQCHTTTVHHLPSAHQILQLPKNVLQ